MTKELEDWFQEECEEVRAEERAKRKPRYSQYRGFLFYPNLS